MLTIRLSRTSKKNQPFFRMVVCDKKNSAKAGRNIEVVGFVNPLTKQKNLKIERIKYWLSVGAKPSDTAHNLLVKEGIIKTAKKPTHSKKLGKKKKEAKAKQEKETPKEATIDKAE